MSANLVHGMSRTPEYMAWSDMKRRCYAKHRREYKNYGARGIVVCARWRQSFANFFADMGRMPGPKYTVERKNNNGNYTPRNCTWIPAGEQSNNRRLVKMRRERWPAVAAFYALGHSLRVTADRFGVSQETARLTVVKGGGSLRDRNARRPS